MQGSSRDRSVSGTSDPRARALSPLSPTYKQNTAVRGSKKLTFQLSEDGAGQRMLHSEGGRIKKATQNGLSHRSQSTPDLGKTTAKSGSSTNKIQSRLRKLKDKWGSGGSQSRLDNAYSDTNISAIPHYDLEFPNHSELISMVQDIQSFTRSHDPVDTYNYRQPSIYQGWKLFKRGVKYQVPPDFSLFWAVTEISPNLRFKMKLYFDPDRRQFFINWDTQLGQITYFDGTRTHRTECKTTPSPDNIWSITVSNKKLQISCNEDTVVEWRLISDQKILCVQPLRFSGKYYLTMTGGTPLKNTSVQQGISMLELDRGSVTDSEDTRSRSPDQQSSVGDYDDTTIKFNRSGGNTFYNNSANHRELLTSQSCPASSNPNNTARNYDTRRRTQSANSRDMVIAKQMLSFTKQIEYDFSQCENSFNQKVKTLDALSNHLVDTLNMIQRESDDSKAYLNRREAEQLNYIVSLEDRIAKLEDILNGSEYNSLSDGFENVIQQYIDSDGFSVPSPVRTNRLPQNIEQQLQGIVLEMNNKLKSLNKRIKTDQSAMVKELNNSRNVIDRFKEDMRSVVLELEAGINSCAEENRLLYSKHVDTVRENQNEFMKVQDQHSTFDMRLNSLDAALEDLEQNHLIEEEFNSGKHYSTVEDLSHTDYDCDDALRRDNILPSIQEDNRMEDLEQMCRDMMEHIQLQARQIDTLREENLVFRRQIREDLGLTEGVREDTIPTEGFMDGERSP